MIQNSNLFLFIKSNSLPSLVRNRPANLSILCLLSARINSALPLFKWHFSISSFLKSSVKNLSIDDLNVISSFTFIYDIPVAPNDFMYSSIFLYHEFDLSILSTFIPLIFNVLNGSKVLFDNIAVKSSISNGFLKSGLSEPYFSIASLYGILLNGIGDTSLSLKWVNIL